MSALNINLVISNIRAWINRRPSSEISRRLARGAFWSIAGTVAVRSFSVLASVVAARILGKDVFGEFGMIQSTVLNFSVFAGYGLGVTATKHIAEFRHIDSAKAGRIMALSSLVAFSFGAGIASLVIVFASLIADSVLAAPHLEDLLRIGALMLFFNAFNGAQVGALAGFEAFRSIARLNLLTGLSTFPLTVGGLLMAGLEGGVMGITVVSALTCLLTHLELRRETQKYGIPVSLRGARHELKVLIRFSLPTTLASLCFGPVSWACSALLVNMPSGYGEMGVFNATTQWFALVMFVPGLLSQVVLPMFADALGRSDDSSVKKTLRLTMKVNALVVTPVVLLGSLASPWIMGLYGEGFAEGWPTLVVVLITAAILAMETPLKQILQARGEAWTIFRLNMIWGTVCLVMCWYMVDLGALGLALSRLLAFALALVLTWRAVTNIQKLGLKETNSVECTVAGNMSS